MKLIRFSFRGNESWGILENDSVFSLEGSVYDNFRKGEEVCELNDVKLLVPAEPKIMVCVGVNFKNATNADGDTVTVERSCPKCFFKPASTLSNPFSGVTYPVNAKDPHLEVELCVVIKKKAKNLSIDEVSDYILGYTCGNELGAMDYIREDNNVTRGRGFDTSGPLGPHLVTELDTSNLALTSRVNGEVVQEGNTDMMIFNPLEVVQHVTSFITLQPGDVVWTGTPQGRSPVKIGDKMEVEVEGIGILENEVLPY